MCNAGQALERESAANDGSAQHEWPGPNRLHHCSVLRGRTHGGLGGLLVWISVVLGYVWTTWCLASTGSCPHSSFGSRGSEIRQMPRPQAESNAWPVDTGTPHER